MAIRFLPFKDEHDYSQDSVVAEVIREYELPDPVRYQAALSVLPPRWQDIIQLLDDGHTQRQIAAMLGFTAENCSYLVKRARTAIRYLLWLPEVSEETIERDLHDLFTVHERALLRYYFRTSCYTHVARLFGVKPDYNAVVSRLHSYICRLEAAGEAFADYVLVFRFLRKCPKIWADSRNSATPPDLALRDLSPGTFVGLPPFPRKSSSTSKWFDLTEEQRQRKQAQDKKLRQANRLRVREQNRLSRERRKAAWNA